LAIKETRLCCPLQSIKGNTIGKQNSKSASGYNILKEKIPRCAIGHTIGLFFPTAMSHTNSAASQNIESQKKLGRHKDSTV